MSSASVKLNKRYPTQNCKQENFFLSNIVGTGQWSVSALFGIWVYRNI